MSAAVDAAIAEKPLVSRHDGIDPLHIWNSAGDPAGAASHAQGWVERHLAQSAEAIDSLIEVRGGRTIGNTLVPYDRAGWHLRMAGSQAHVMFMVHPEAEVRDRAQALSQQISAAGVELSLNRDVYAALSQLDVSGEDDATRYYVERTLQSYRLSGVDRDDATREKVRSLADRMTMLSMQFSRAVQDDVRTIAVDDVDGLRGLPADYLDRHGVKTAADGSLSAEEPVKITTDPPEMSPVMSYAASPALRRELYLAYNDRGYPANKQVLLDLLAAREEMAGLLGFRSWADLATADQMIGSAASIRKFLNDVEAAAIKGAEREYTGLTAFVREREADALPLTLSDARFWEEQYRRSRFNFDSQSVRPYFPYAQVEAGILATTGRLFGVRFQRAENAPVWASDVEAFDVVDARGEARPLGRIYLDMHPREGKSKWFSECSLVAGVRGECVPEASLVCNFPAPSANDPGLMLYSDVVTYFHEFGHLMHEVLGGQQRWAGQSGIATEGDFVEVPSQMLEEFFEDPALLQSFAKHYQTGEPIPAETVRLMTKAAAHGRALSTLTQVMYATYSMETHDRRASELDLDALLRQGHDRFSRYEFVDGNRMYAAFTHLIGYTSNYYTYLYDKVMALEFFEQFDKANLLDGDTARRYRETVLEAGGSRPARELVQAFLGRESSTAALHSWIANAAE